MTNNKRIEVKIDGEWWIVIEMLVRDKDWITERHTNCLENVQDIRIVDEEEELEKCFFEVEISLIGTEDTRTTQTYKLIVTAKTKNEAENLAWEEIKENYGLIKVRNMDYPDDIKIEDNRVDEEEEFNAENHVFELPKKAYYVEEVSILMSDGTRKKYKSNMYLDDIPEEEEPEEIEKLDTEKFVLRDNIIDKINQLVDAVNKINKKEEK